MDLEVRSSSSNNNNNSNNSTAAADGGAEASLSPGACSSRSTVDSELGTEGTSVLSLRLLPKKTVDK